MLEIVGPGGNGVLQARATTGALLSTRIARLRPHQLDLIRRTVAHDCTNEEFDLFIEAAERYGLDPFRRQIMPLVFSKEKPEKRRMVIVIGIDGQRMIAQRAGNYRPASEPTHFVENRRKKGPTNPARTCSRPRHPLPAGQSRRVVSGRRRGLLGRVRADPRRMGGGSGAWLAEDRPADPRSLRELAENAAADAGQMRHHAGAARRLAGSIRQPLR